MTINRGNRAHFISRNRELILHIINNPLERDTKRIAKKFDVVEATAVNALKALNIPKSRMDNCVG